MAIHIWHSFEQFLGNQNRVGIARNTAKSRSPEGDGVVDDGNPNGWKVIIKNASQQMRLPQTTQCPQSRQKAVAFRSYDP